MQFEDYTIITSFLGEESDNFTLQRIDRIYDICTY